MTRNLLLACIALLSFSLVGQKNLADVSLSGLAFREVGPALTSGRIADIAVNPDDFNEYYVGTASGGLWKTTNHGVTFTPIFDGQSSYSIGCVTLDPQNANTVWVGTGENNNQRSVPYGDGVYLSKDGGQSWKNMGLEKSEHIGMIKVHPKNSNIVYVAAYGPLWSAGGERGIYKTTDGGTTWELTLEVSEHTGFNEIHLDPRNPEVLYAAAHQRRRHVWTYVSGGPESAIYKSEDGGENWRKLEQGLPAEKGRIGLAIAPANPDIIYAMLEGHGTYKSTNRGESFTKTNDYNTSGNYYVELVPHPTEVDILYSMDTYMHITKDGGKTWQRVPEKNKHVDNHCLWINPQEPRHMIAGCDGGLYETFNHAKDWHYKPNLPVTQFYRVAVDNAEPFYNIYGGTQDNFSLGGPSQTINNRGIVNSDWFVTNTGDGFESQVDPENPNIVYAQAQYGWLVRYDKVSGESVGIKPSPNEDEKAYRWNWDAPLLISPHDPKRLYFAANKVFKSDNRGNDWEVISPDLTQQIDRHSLPVMGKIQSVDAISYDRSTSVYGNIVALDESPLKEGLLYAGTDDGLIQVSENGGASWKEYSTFPGVPQNTYVNQVVASLYDENTVYAVFQNHKNGDFKPYLLKSTNRGVDWQPMSGDLPERGSTFSLKQDHINKDLFFVGTEFGVHFTLNGGQNWQALKNGLPTIAVRDLEIQRREDDLVLATFGRGFYVLDDYSPLRGLSEKVVKQDAHLFPVKDATVFLEAAPLGYSKAGFMGASYYMAPNPKPGAAFDLYLKEVPKTKKDRRQTAEKEARKNNQSIVYPSLDSLRAEQNEEQNYLLFIIKDVNGQEVRRFTKPMKKGLNRYYWDGKLSGFTRLNNDKEPLTNANTTALAKPGNYAVEIFKSLNGQLLPLTDESQTFKLKWLNNNTFRAGDKTALAAFQQELEKVRREFRGLSQLHHKLSKRQQKLKALARNTPGAPLTILNDLQKVEEQLQSLDIQLHGDAVRSKHYFESVPSLEDRINSAAYNSYRTTSSPTGEQKKNLRIVSNSTVKLRGELNALEQELSTFYEILLSNGAPYLDGDLD
jgi:photosystem II stability/assembly factor-like uncharacterized protein